MPERATARWVSAGLRRGSRKRRLMMLLAVEDGAGSRGRSVSMATRSGNAGAKIRSHGRRVLATQSWTISALLPLPVLALLIGVHVKTLRAAARDGRLPVTYDTRTTFRRLRARATPAAARAFRRSYYGRTVRPADCRAPLTWTSVPKDYDVQIRALRRARELSQAQLATLVGAAHKAVVYHMGGAETHAVAAVLATTHRAPSVSWAWRGHGGGHGGPRSAPGSAVGSVRRTSVSATYSAPT